MHPIVSSQGRVHNALKVFVSLIFSTSNPMHRLNAEASDAPDDMTPDRQYYSIIISSDYRKTRPTSQIVPSVGAGGSQAY